MRLFEKLLWHAFNYVCILQDESTIFGNSRFTQWDPKTLKRTLFIKQSKETWEIAFFCVPFFPPPPLDSDLNSFLRLFGVYLKEFSGFTTLLGTHRSLLAFGMLCRLLPPAWKECDARTMINRWGYLCATMWRSTHEWFSEKRIRQNKKRSKKSFLAQLSISSHSLHCLIPLSELKSHSISAKKKHQTTPGSQR